MDKLLSILLVEDDFDDAFLLQHTLENTQLIDKVHVCRDGVTALDFINNHVKAGTSNSIDLILLDLSLPRMDGWEFLQRFNQLDLAGSRPKLVILTSSLNPGDEAKAYSTEGVGGFLIKPIQPAEFEQMVGRLFR